MHTQAKYRHALPQLQGGWFLTDGGLETTLVFHDGIDLPCFASCYLLNDAAGIAHLKAYFEPYIAQARARGAGFILESATWRAHADFAQELGYSTERLIEVNRLAIEVLEDIRAAHETDGLPMVISGCMGPRGDGYFPDKRMSAAAAADYHSAQIETFAGTAADMVTAMTLNYPEEGIGIALAAQAAGIPSVISFTVETDGRLPSGDTLQSAIEAVDNATGGAPAYYMINCAHPTHFRDSLNGAGGWRERIRAVRANASCKSHEELDNSEELDVGNPDELGQQYREMLVLMGHLNVLGGCCGTDHRHIGAIGQACASHYSALG
jgi:S-methylmethionine-dependent homocysteine/selenocysteine methylase